MALWEYKVITSGKGGFASATMLESYLNQLGKDEWEIIDFRTDSTNTLAFNGLARRPTQREWTLEAAVAAAAKAEADKLRAELMHKQHAGDAVAASDAPAGSTAGDKAAGPDSLRQLRDTDRDHDPEALADEASHGADDWSNLDTYEDDLPTFFDAIKPHLRKNQNTPGQSVALNYLAKRWEQPESDLNGALKECGFVIPESETEAPAFVEFEGDLYWVEKNNRGQFFLNTREKPRPKYRIVPAKPLDPSDPVYVALAEEQAAAQAERDKRVAEQAAREAEAQAKRAEREAQRLAAEQARREQQAAAQAAREAAQAAREAARAAAAANVAPASGSASVSAPAESAPVASDVVAPGSSEPAPAVAAIADGEAPAPAKTPAPAPTGGTLPSGEALLDAIRPQMRRNRRGPGYSGSSAYLAKFFKVEEAALRAALAELGLVLNEAPGGKAEDKVIGAYVYWINKDGNGGLWINGREATPRDRAGAGKPSAPAGDSVATPAMEAPTASAVSSAPAPSSDGEPPIFRAVPRAMPPIPVAEPAVAEHAEPAVGEAAPAPAPVSVSENASVAEVVVEAPPAAPVASDAPALVLESESAPASKPAKAAAGRKPRGKSASAAEADSAAAPAADADAPIDVVKPAKAAPKPRTKRRASAAIDADAAAEE